MRIRHIIGSGLVLLVILTATIVAYLTLHPSTNPPGPLGSYELKWLRTGGIAGMRLQLAIGRNGSWQLENSMSGSVKRSVGTLNTTMKALLDSISIAELKPFNGSNFVPNDRARDFFSYELELSSDEGVVQVSWVDNWASTTPLPLPIINAQNALTQLVGELQNEK